MRVTVRLFAAARAAVGSPESIVELGDGATVGDALRALDPSGGAASVLDRCSVLLDAVAEDRDAAARDGSTIDVLPPFAGG